MENFSLGQMSRVERADKNGWYDDDTGFSVIHDYLVEVARSNVNGKYRVVRHVASSINHVLEGNHRMSTNISGELTPVSIYKVDGGKLVEIYYDENAVN